MLRRLRAYILHHGVAIAAILISAYTLLISTGVREDTRAIAGLDLEPSLLYQQWFSLTPPHVTVTNIGQVDIKHLLIQPICYQNVGENHNKAAIISSEHRQIVGELIVGDTISFPLSEYLLNTECRLSKPLETNVMEIRLEYMRPPDMKRFVKGAFYFIAPEGHWAPAEGDAQLLQAVLRISRKTQIFSIRDGGRLHTIDLEPW